VLTAFARAFKTPDLRKKLLFTLSIMALFRLGSQMPTPGVSTQAINRCLKPALESGGAYQLVNLFSGGALLQLSIFALGIMPYITASIIIQLLVVVIPRLETLKKEGQAGTAKLTQYTRYLTIGLAVLQASGLVALAKQRPDQLLQGCQEDLVYQSYGVFGAIAMIITMTAGTAMVMWLGELITDRGVGNGMSLLIFTSIAAQFPAQIWAIKQAKSGSVGGGWPILALVILVGIVMVAAVVFVEQAQRRVPVQYAKRMIGRRMYGGSSTYIPLKVNQAGVIPVIFASSLLYIPMLAVGFSNQQNPPAWATFIGKYFQDGTHPYYLITYFVLIIFFAFFYVSITFNPTEVADNMKKYGGFIPGIRAGRPTAEYLDYVLTRITWPGSMYLGLVAVIPMLAIGLVSSGNSGQSAFGGASLLIIVGVGLETVKQIESQLQQRNYEGFLR
jgi:preprotein translocase subunit SecY